MESLVLGIHIVVCKIEGEFHSEGWIRGGHGLCAPVEGGVLEQGDPHTSGVGHVYHLHLQSGIES